jgi:DNA-binding response OmpR family regulator
MSYKSLLFCPDERTARLVAQVLKELEFAVESANEPFAAVKKLEVERFDALIVDCQNEQDASLLFKTARNSSQNHSSLSVAVVEGQAGVAKAFRIGANLVLTKPINVEQSKGTLRVARGLLRKSDTKAPAPSASAKPFLEVPAASQPTRSELSLSRSQRPKPLKLRCWNPCHSFPALRQSRVGYPWRGLKHNQSPPAPQGTRQQSHRLSRKVSQ